MHGTSLCSFSPGALVPVAASFSSLCSGLCSSLRVIVVAVLPLAFFLLLLVLKLDLSFAFLVDFFVLVFLGLSSPVGL